MRSIVSIEFRRSNQVYLRAFDQFSPEYQRIHLSGAA
ncbi:phycobilisome linker polypeptide [Microcoleus sp. Aus8_D1]